MGLRKRTCEIMQYQEYALHFNKEFILGVIAKHNCIVKYAFILHDKDINDDGSLKKPHWHIFLQFSEAQKFSDVSNWFAVGEQYVNCLRTRFDSAVVYLIHLNAPDKYQYSNSDVVSNFNFVALCVEYNNKKLLNEKMDFVSHNMMYYKRLYWDNPKRLKDVKYCYDNWLDIQSKEKMNMNKEVIYVCGDSGCGKTTYAKWLAFDSYPKDEIFISSSSNDILYGYNGEKCIILDDLRDDAMKFADLMKFLDNNTSSSVKARYNNKQMARCEMIIITSIKEPYELYLSLDETKIQLYRRLKVFMKIKRIDDKVLINYYKWNDNTNKFDYTYCFDFTEFIRKFIEENSGTSDNDPIIKKMLDKGVQMTFNMNDDDDKYPF